MDTKEVKLPLRDWLLLPLVGLLTICSLIGVGELLSRRLFSESNTHLSDCLVLNDPTTGVRAVPNSLCREKMPEQSQPIEYQFDSCGYRSGTQCEPKRPGTYRIVATGSSVAMGERVPFQQSLAALLPAELSEQTGTKVQLYDEGMAFGYARNTAAHFKDVLNAKPDLILWVLTPKDVQDGDFSIPGPLPPRRNDFVSRAVRTAKGSLGSSVRMLQHVLYASETGDQYVTSYLKGQDAETGFLMANPPPIWSAYLASFDRHAADVESRASMAGIPVTAVLLPSRPQAAMLRMDKWPAGYNPYKLDAELREIIVRHGGTYISVLHGFGAIRNPEQFYLPVDGHPIAPAHAIFARLIAEELISGGAVPSLRVASLKASEGKGR
jgi:hypothetical protein